jgi:dTDP-4-amino-4,6-dideoxygalactose transaminase
MKKIPFHKAYMNGDEVREVLDVIKSGWLTMGPKTVEFEGDFKDYTGARYAVAVNSCTAALHLALEAIGIKEGDEVLVPAVTFTATAEVVTYFRAKPVFVDVEKDTCNMDVCKVEEKITKKTRAIIPMDYGGQPVDYDELRAIAKRHGLFIIEDGAHTLPSEYKGRNVGVLADITCFSFYATKALSTGEGGMITTSREKWAKRLRIMRLHGISKDAWRRQGNYGSWNYKVVDAGFKYNMTDIQAALGIAQLKKIDTMYFKRRKIAEKYNEAFRKIEEVIVPRIKEDRSTSWHLYVIKLKAEKLKIDRNKFIEELAKRGVSASVHFTPLYRHPFYAKKYGETKKDFPSSEWVYRRIISLPIYPSMTNKDVQTVISSVKYIIEKNRK